MVERNGALRYSFFVEEPGVLVVGIDDSVVCEFEIVSPVFCLLKKL